MTNPAIISNKNPPGPQTPWFGLPLVGELKNDTLGTVLRLREQFGDVVHFRIAKDRFYYIYSPELIREMLVEHADDFVRHERAIEIFTLMYGTNVLTAEHGSWKRQRRILMPGFLPKKIAGYVNLMVNATTDSFATAIPAGTGKRVQVDVDDFTTRLTMDVILRVLFSHKASEEESVNVSQAVRTLEHQGMRELFWPKTPPNWFPYPGRAKKLHAMGTLENMIRGQIKARRDAGGAQADNSDYLAMLLNAHDEEAQSDSQAATLTSEEIYANCAVIFAAGHDTTATALTWWIGLMAQHPDYADKLRKEIAEVIGDKVPTQENLMRLAWVNATLKESMRLYPPAASLFFRRAIRDVQIGGWTIPQGASVNVPIWHVQHDARWFAEPERFMPERFMPGAPELPRGAYMPFGAGPRVCIGQHFAMIEMALIATVLLQQFDFAFADGQGLSKAKIDMTLKPQIPLKVDFIRR